MFQQYEELKSRHRDAILLFRLGDFYEMFGADATEGSRILGLTLTQRQGKPMCGVPHHASRGYIRRLLAHGKKVAVCEQVSEPDGKSLTRREVVEVLSPGAVFDPDFLDAERNNYILAIGAIYDHRSERPTQISVAACDASVGSLTLASYRVDAEGEGAEVPEAVIRRELERFDPGELLVQESLLESSDALRSFTTQRTGRVINRIPDWGFDQADSYRRLVDHLNVTNLHGYGFDDSDPALLPVATILEYLQDNTRHALTHLRRIERVDDGDRLILDDATVKNLEIVRNIRDGGSAFSLVEIVDESVTAMGSRRIRRYLLEPLRRREAIEARLDRVEDLYHRQSDLHALRERLRDAYDLERLVGRLGIGKAHPKDVLAMGRTLAVVAAITPIVPAWLTQDENLKAIETSIVDAIADDPPIVVAEGGVIRSGFDAELDRLREIRDDSHGILEAYLAEMRNETGISSLKIKYNRMLGHFFEVPSSQASRVPDQFIRRQSLANAERFTTPRLSELESEINNAEDAAIDRERELFRTLLERLVHEIPVLHRVAEELAEVDAVAALTYTATQRGYRRPSVVDDAIVDIRGGRHPVVEAHLPPGEFVSNDLTLAEEENRFALITGPNMAGKSTVLRQTALITLLAHIGSFVPADEATIGVCDRIFCRVGASDNIARGESTFLVEMNETSNILRNATRSSLVIMDEVGRGTSTHDGLSIAWAVSEYLLNQTQARTLFATHYHELTNIEHPLFTSMSMAVEHSAEQIYFLKRLVPGGEDRSYGVDVARLAGLPDIVVSRARRLLDHFERYGTHGAVEATNSEPAEATSINGGDDDRDGRPSQIPAERRVSRQGTGQDELFSAEQIVLEEIKNVNPEEITPRGALDLVFRWNAATRGERNRSDTSQ